MYYPEKNEFIRLSKKGTLIPVFREIVADTETPVSAFSKIAGKNSFLLESVEGGENVARYSFLGCDPYLIFKSKGRSIEIASKSGNSKRAKVARFQGDPFIELKKILEKYKPVKIEGLPKFHGGAVGYIGYDTVRFIEDIPDKNKDDIKMPDCQFFLTDTMLAFDHVKHKIIVISNAHIQGSPAKAYEEAVSKIDRLVKKVTTASVIRSVETGKKKKKIKITSNISKKDFERSVKKAKEYIRNGDVIQVVLSQRFNTKITKDPFEIYRNLRIINPSPYMYYFDFGASYIIGTSPEVMVSLEGDSVSIRPIAGTAVRGRDEKEDKKFEERLLKDEKERAEHVMLVDLARNDLGRVCQRGSIKVTDFMSVEKYSHVMHIVSNVCGKLQKKYDAVDLFKATFPAGTVTGAPKVRAMEIIDELEHSRRGPYAGAVGYFDYAGNLDTCITIRTIVVKGEDAYIQAGMGIVADSVPEKEYYESVNKAKAMFKAIEGL